MHRFIIFRIHAVLFVRIRFCRWTLAIFFAFHFCRCLQRTPRPAKQCHTHSFVGRHIRGIAEQLGFFPKGLGIAHSATAGRSWREKARSTLLRGVRLYGRSRQLVSQKPDITGQFYHDSSREAREYLGATSHLRKIIHIHGPRQRRTARRIRARAAQNGC